MPVNPPDVSIAHGLPFPARLRSGSYDYGTRTSGETHGVVLTKPHVVELILDLAGYTEDRDLGAIALLEPACGEGAFVVAAVRRLVASARAHRREIESLTGAVVAFDIEPDHVARTRAAVVAVLRKERVSTRVAGRLAGRWIRQGDFLLADHEGTYDAVVGNPPYVRIEQLDQSLQLKYRARYETIFDRADLYVAFIEAALRLLSPTGVVSYVCADRWMNNQYGKPLRKLVTTSFCVRWYIDLHAASPFESEVIAYPAIFAIGQGKTTSVRVARMATASTTEVRALRRKLGADAPADVELHPEWFKGEDPWVLSSPEHVAALRDLEARCPTIEGDGNTRIGIGVASGADSVYIVDASTDIEADRLVPLVMRDDIEKGGIRDARRCIINTFGDGGAVVDLDAYPKLRAYLQGHEGLVRRRHVAKSNPTRWFRTIDRVYPDLVSKPKLLIPDIAGSNEVTFDAGRYHPHHNLYFVTSTTWDLEVLGGLLCSKVALFFVWSYAVKMRGGYLRFQAQYLRRIRVPAAVPDGLARRIKAAFRKRDFKTLDRLALEAYGITRLPDFEFVDTRN